MSIFQKQIDKLKDLNITDVMKSLKGKNVPISDIENLKVLDANDEELKFERDLTEDELSYFRNWLKGEMQKNIRKNLEL